MSDAYAVTQAGCTYFMTFTVVGWIDLFTSECYRNIVTDRLSFFRKHKQLSIHGWVMMSNHLHLITSVPEDIFISAVVRDFKKHTSRIIIESLQNEQGESVKNGCLICLPLWRALLPFRK